MAKKKIHIDGLFRKGLGGMKLPVEGSDWAAMQAAIATQQNKRKRRLIWWWVAGFAALVCGAAALGMYTNSTKTNTPVTVDKNSPLGKLIDSVINESKTLNNTTQNIDNEINKITSKEKKEVSEPITATTGKEKTTPIGSTQQGKKKTNTAKSGKQKPKNSSAKNKDFKKDSQEVSPAENTPVESPAPNNILPQNTSIEAKDTTGQTADEKNDAPTIAAIDDDSSKKQTTAPPEKKTQTPTPFSLSIAFGPTANTFTSDNNSNFGKILNAANQPALGFTANVLLHYTTGRWAINTGIGINNIANKGNYNYSHQTFDSIPVLNPQGGVIGYFYTNFRDTTHNFNLQSTYTYITLPIGISYSLPINPKSGIHLGATASLQYLVATQGEYINPFNLFKLDVNENKALFRKYNLGISTSLGYYYNINNKLTLEGALQLNSLTRSMFNKQIGTATRQRSIGISIGLKYNLTKKK